MNEKIEPLTWDEWLAAKERLEEDPENHRFLDGLQVIMEERPVLQDHLEEALRLGNELARALRDIVETGTVYLPPETMAALNEWPETKTEKL